MAGKDGMSGYPEKGENPNPETYRQRAYEIIAQLIHQDLVQARRWNWGKAFVDIFEEEEANMLAKAKEAEPA